MNRFLKTQRILSPKAYKAVLNNGQKRHTSHFILFTRNNGLKEHRLGLIVTKKIANAVYRNRIKRTIREFFRLTYGEIVKAPSFHDVVFIAKRGAEALSTQEIIKEIEAKYAKHSHRNYRHIPVVDRASVA